MRGLRIAIATEPEEAENSYPLLRTDSLSRVRTQEVFEPANAGGISVAHSASCGLAGDKS
jgi:hypothetical protein